MNTHTGGPSAYTGMQQPIRTTSDQAAEASRVQDEAFLKPEIVASATECTGLSPAAVLSEQEADAYAQLYSVHRQLPAQGRNVTPKNTSES